MYETKYPVLFEAEDFLSLGTEVPLFRTKEDPVFRTEDDLLYRTEEDLLFRTEEDLLFRTEEDPSNLDTSISNPSKKVFLRRIPRLIN